MSGAVLVYFPDADLARVDAIVAERKRRHAAGPPPAVMAEAKRITAEKGPAAAQAFLSGKQGARPSRVRVLQELVALGLEEYARQHRPTAREAHARKKAG
jgi:hypothetical protein